LYTAPVQCHQYQFIPEGEVVLTRPLDWRRRQTDNQGDSLQYSQHTLSVGLYKQYNKLYTCYI